jgi:hypothetical protein
MNVQDRLRRGRALQRCLIALGVAWIVGLGGLTQEVGAAQASFTAQVSPEVARFRVTAALGNDDAAAQWSARVAAMRQAAQDLSGDAKEKAKLSAWVDRSPEATRELARIARVLTRVFADEGDGVEISADVDIDTKQLRLRLQQGGVMASTAALAEAVANPVIMVVAVSKSAVSEAESKIVQDAVTAPLLERHWNMVDGVAIEEARKRQNAVTSVAGASIDPVSDLAAAAGADIYISWAVEYVDGQAVASISAFETATGQLLGSSSRPSRRYADQTGRAKTMTEAVQNAMPQLLEQVSGYWHSALTEGRRVRVAIHADRSNRDAYRKMRDAFKRLGNRQKEARTQESWSFVLLTRLGADEVEDGIADAVEDSGLGPARHLIASRALHIVSVP